MVESTPDQFFVVILVFFIGVFLVDFAWAGTETVFMGRRTGVHFNH